LNWSYKPTGAQVVAGDAPMGSAVLELRDAHGGVVWFGDRVPVQEILNGRDSGTQFISVPLPSSSVDGYSIHLKLFNERGESADCMLTTVPAPQLCPARHFKLVEQYPNNIRIYENTKALPRAYIVSDTIYAPNTDAALDHIRAMDFDPRLKLIVEQRARWMDSGRRKATQAIAMSVWANSSEVKIEYSSPRDCLVAWVESYAPGWEARVDNRAVKILRANLCFQAIEVPPGKHTITFAYHSWPLFCGSCLLLLFAGSMLALAIMSVRSHIAISHRP
jgi:hypothetical protein